MNLVKQFAVDVCVESFYRYWVPANSEKEAKKIVQEAIDSGEGLDEYSSKCKSEDATIV